MSAVWAYFIVKKEDTRLAICNSCKCEVMRGGNRTKNFSTSNLISHLKFRHTEIYKDYQMKVTAKQTLPTTNKPVQQTLDNTKKFDKDSAKAKAINCKVMEMIAIDDQPFSIVEDFGFRRLIEFIEPRYSLPSRRHFADVLLPALYNEVAAHIQMLLGKNVTGISFTTDLWSSDVSPVSMLSLTAQWIEDSFEMRRVMLNAPECPGSHTSAAIASALESMFVQWNITKDMVHAVLRDNGRNMVRAIEDWFEQSWLHGCKRLSADSGVKTTKATLLEAVKQRFNGIYTEPLYLLATILDPRYKDRFFDQATKQQAIEMLLRKLNKMTEPENSMENERNETEPPLKKTCTESDGCATSLLDMYGEILEENMDKEH